MIQGTDICGNTICSTNPDYCNKDLMEPITITQNPHNSNTLTFKIQTNLNVIAIFITLLETYNFFCFFSNLQMMSHGDFTI
jgi:hypothetical protein